MAFDPIIAQAFLSELADGKMSMRAIVESRPDFYPSRHTFWKWLRENEDFAAQYIIAREMQMHSYADDTVYRADTATPENANVVRMQIATRQWMAERLEAKTYRAENDDNTHVMLHGQVENASMFRHMTKEERSALREIITSATKRQQEAEADQHSGRPKQIEGKAKRRA